MVGSFVLPLAASVDAIVSATLERRRGQTRWVLQTSRNVKLERLSLCLSYPGVAHDIFHGGKVIALPRRRRQGKSDLLVD